MPDLLIEMPSGVAGDMLLAALLDLGGDLERLNADLATLGIPDLRVEREAVRPGGIAATRVSVAVPQDATWEPVSGHHHHHDHHEHGHHEHGDHEHSHDHSHDHVHRPYRAIRELLDRVELAPRVRDRAQRVFRLIAEAEGAAHGVEPADVHFHEVGSADAIADIVGCCLLLDQLQIDRVISGPLTLGSGTVRCAHGRMPVPVPAVAHMLSATGAPQRRVNAETGELTTPTGCALVCGLSDSFDLSDAGNLIATGYGSGHKEIDGMVNLVRVSSCQAATSVTHDHVVELRCQLDDATPEHLAYAVEQLLAVGARDAYLTPIVMKKGRAGHELTVLASPVDYQRLSDWLLTNTPTIGVRANTYQRQILPRTEVCITIDGYDIHLKVVTLPDGTQRAKPEADEVAIAAIALNRDFADVQQAALSTWQAST